MKSTLFGIPALALCIWAACAISVANGAPPEKDETKAASKQSTATPPIFETTPANVPPTDPTKADKPAKATKARPSERVSRVEEPKPKIPRLTDPIAVLKYAAKAAERIDHIYYEASTKGYGTMASEVPALWGTVILGGESTGGFDKFRFMKPDVVPGPAGLVTAMVGSDGKTFFLVDVKHNTVTQSYDPKVMSDMGPLLPYVAVLELLYPEPFAKEMKADKLELRPDALVAGVPCYVVHVSTKGGRQQTDWYFSTKDLLPRRVDRITKDASGKTGTAQLVLSNISVNPRLARDPFTAYFPEGSKSVDLREPKPQEPKAQKPEPKPSKP
ncbi:MAG: hypothetical protein JSU63_00730 [Phycisphaerales bacterium]|nr:MAG: hypothetical protein JSU63_00730 [Phycisphaerales bacterium]